MPEIANIFTNRYYQSMKLPQQRVYLDISWRALFKIVALVIGIFAVVFLRDILVMLFAVFILVAALNPLVARLQQYVPRILAVIFLYVLIFAGLALISSLLIPNFVRQLNDLVAASPSIMDHLRPYVDGYSPQRAHFFDQAVTSASDQLKIFSSTLLQSTYGLFGAFATLISGVAISFYLLLEEENAKHFFHQILPQKEYEVVYETVNKITSQMGSWVRSELLLMLTVAVANFFLLLILGVHTPLPLATWSGLCELVPVIGPAIGVLPALVVSLTSGNLLQAALVLLLCFVFVQQVEVHILIPRLMGKALGLSPVLVIIALLIGTRLFGFAGALLSVPCAAVISVIVGEYAGLRKMWETRASA